MIEVTTDYIDGVMFYQFRLLKPEQKKLGIGIHRVDWKLRDRHLSLLGLRKVGQETYCRVDLYASMYPSYILSCIYFLERGYWKTIRFLYDNARLFKQIPQGERFSWRYFTPYVWVKGIVSKIWK